MASVTDFAALLVSVVALAVSGIGVFQTRASLDMAKKSLDHAEASNKIAQQSLEKVIEHNEKTLRPKLRYVYGLGLSASQPASMKIENVGDGVAEITAIEATFDGRSIVGPTGNLEAETLADLAKKHGILGLEASLLRKGEFVAKQATVTVFTVKAQALGPQICTQDSLRKEFAKRLQIKISYKSLYEFGQVLLPAQPPQNTDCKSVAKVR